MGSSQSFISSETALTLLVAAGAVGVGYSQFGKTATKPARSGTSGSTSAPEISGKKGKKKKKGPATVSSSQADVPPGSSRVPPVVPFPTLIPGSFDAVASTVSEPVPSSKRSKGKKKKTKLASSTTQSQPDVSPAAGYNSESSAGDSEKPNPKPQDQSASSSPPAIRPFKQSTVSIDTDGSWTRVESGRRTHDAASTSEGPSADVTTSDAGVVTGDSSPIAERTEDDGIFYRSRTSAESRRPLAERLLPKPRKTGVADMLESPDHPTLSRVMRVQPRADEKPASGFSWGDYEDVRDNAVGENDADGEDEGWGVVTSKSRSKIDRGASSSQAQQQKAPETLTKRQRQNASKREAQKAAKAEAEGQRLTTLTKHKRALERERMLEQLSKSGGGKTPSGGMKAAVDERGKLVWE
ncbi:hypothetical protein Hypma_007068 [Hypsizygus marmoreus]|uniref:INO80 complex subunit B-like conserved region domain-containing protein n=1 Tax=Hypsizygus marmoreus TaxID=39966 RepID=A0A369KFI9_HYPMA|nr:hypothetical protein Hypma_007068 [Hypsizygus marmoreus]